MMEKRRVISRNTNYILSEAFNQHTGCAATGNLLIFFKYTATSTKRRGSPAENTHQ